MTLFGLVFWKVDHNRLHASFGERYELALERHVYQRIKSFSLKRDAVLLVVSLTFLIKCFSARDLSVLMQYSSLSSSNRVAFESVKNKWMYQLEQNAKRNQVKYLLESLENLDRSSWEARECPRPFCPVARFGLEHSLWSLIWSFFQKMINFQRFQFRSSWYT